jgi:hypothetical protein
MKAGQPDNDDVPPPAPSLAGKLAGALRREAPAGEGWPAERLAVAVAALIALGPVLTIGGAALLARREAAASATLQAELAPRIAAARQSEVARTRLSAALAQRPMANTLEALGRVLPPEASVVRAERTRAGALEIDIATPDPDKLRMALRRASEFGQIRNVAQRQGDAGMIVTFLGGAE